jgi:hypothetical protein
VTALASPDLRPWGLLRTLGVRGVDEVLDACKGRPLFLVDGLIHSTATMVYGVSGGGKTWFMVDVVAAVARGDDWFGQAVTGGPRRCLVLASDPDGEREYAERLAVALEDPERDNVFIWEPPPVDPHAWAQLAQELVEEEFGLVVIDNLYSWAGEVDMIKNAEVARPLACIKALTAVGIPVVLVHHTNDGGRKPAGVHAIKAFFRHLVRVTERHLSVSGNSSPEVAYQIRRDAGRIIEVRRGMGDNPDSTTSRGSSSNTKAEQRRQQARGLLDQEPFLRSDHARGAYLAARMPDVFLSDEAGRSVVKALRKQGWAPPSGTSEASVSG